MVTVISLMQLNYLHELHEPLCYSTLKKKAKHDRERSAYPSCPCVAPSIFASPCRPLHHADGYLRVVKSMQAMLWLCEVEGRKARRLATKTVEGTALPLEGVDDVEGGDGLALGVLSICDRVADDAFEESLEDTAGLFVDHCLTR